MKLHCPLCGAIALTTSGTWESGCYAADCVRSARIWISRRTDSGGRKQCLVSASDGEVELDIPEMKMTPFGCLDPSLIPGYYVIISVEPPQPSPVTVERDEEFPNRYWIKVADPNDLSELPPVTLPPPAEKTWRDRAIEEPML